MPFPKTTRRPFTSVDRPKSAAFRIEIVSTSTGFVSRRTLRPRIRSSTRTLHRLGEEVIWVFVQLQGQHQYQANREHAARFSPLDRRTDPILAFIITKLTVLDEPRHWPFIPRWFCRALW